MNTPFKIIKGYKQYWEHVIAHLKICLKKRKNHVHHFQNNKGNEQ